MLIDVNVSLGPWPFWKFQEDSPEKLSKHLKSEEISLALVSSLETVFYPDPQLGNRDLFIKLKPYPNLIPIIVSNPSLSSWKEMLEKYDNLYKIKAVKILPNYHNYSVSSSFVSDLMKELNKRKIPLIIQMRLEDERNQYPLLKVRGVRIEEIINLAKSFPNVPIITLCPYFQEAISLVKESPNIYIDISFIERLNTLKTLLEKVPGERVLFGSHTPFLYTRSAVMKVKTADIPEKDREAIASGNICRILGLKEGCVPISSKV